MQIFFANCTSVWTRTQEETFEDVFLIKIASKWITLTDCIFEMEYSKNPHLRN